MENNNQEFFDRLNAAANKRMEEESLDNVQDEKKYTAKKGTIDKVRNRGDNNLKNKIISLVLAGLCVIGGGATIAHKNDNPPPSIEEIQKKGTENGLSKETIEGLKECDDFFEEFNKREKTLTDEDVLKLISKIKNLHFKVIKQRIAQVTGRDEENIKIWIDVAEEGGFDIVVSTTDLLREKETYRNKKFLESNKNTLPKEISDTIENFWYFQGFTKSIISDEEKKADIVEKLKGMYNELKVLASGILIQDNRGNITFIPYEKEKNVEARDVNEKNIDRERD